MLFALIRIFFACACRISLRFTAWAAHLLFRAPPKPDLSPEQQKLLPLADEVIAGSVQRFASNRGRNIAGYFFAASGPSRGCIALMHGWMSASRYMMAYVEPLTAAGFDVLAFDAPAHGASGGRMTTGRDSAGAFFALVDEFDDLLPKGVTGVIGHSFGGAAAAFCAWLSHPKVTFNTHGVVLVAVPNEMRFMTSEFAKAIGLTPKARAAFEAVAIAELGLSMDELTGTHLWSTTRPKMLQLHDPADDEVPFEQGAQYAALGPQVEIRPFAGVGHRDIIFDEGAVNAAVDFFRQ